MTKVKKGKNIRSVVWIVSIIIAVINLVSGIIMFIWISGDTIFTIPQHREAQSSMAAENSARFEQYQQEIDQRTAEIQAEANRREESYEALKRRVLSESSLDDDSSSVESSDTDNR